MDLESVAIIPDGNRRYSKKHELSLHAAYLAGFKKAQQAAEWARDEGLDKMSFWALSLENYQKRSKTELRLLFELMSRQVQEAISSQKTRDGPRIRFAGRLDLLPSRLSSQMSALEERTRDNKDELVVAVAYSGREELVNAAKKLAEDVARGRVNAAEVNEDTFSKYLYLNYSPDLVIRTGGVTRLSGFLPFQTAYSELYFSKRLWPEFSRADFRKAVEHYYAVERRFGK
ncbi:MAG: polyprenyl diphosphate synthase [Candidatus Micrarchaeota archaeon]|nr:polyprenyl diphosphate synthase [Candidatus Micrarchaeota archaeon]